jgi:hypothetical protein
MGNISMSRWFRLYDETLNDPKILKLSHELYRRWTQVLCIASKNEGTIPNVEDVAIYLRFNSVSEAQKILDELVACKLIDRHKDGTLTPHNWRKRQYKSDISTSRVKRFRKQHRNVSVTPPETDTEQSRTETDKKDNSFERFWSSYPRKVAKKAAERAFDKAIKETTLAAILHAVSVDRGDWKDEKFIPHPATWLNDGRYLDHGPAAELKTYRPPGVDDGPKISERTTGTGPIVLDESPGIPDEEFGGVGERGGFKPGIRRMG